MNGTSDATRLSSRERLGCGFDDDPEPAPVRDSRAQNREPDWSKIPTRSQASSALAVVPERVRAVAVQSLPTLPSAPNAMHGVVLAWLAKDLPPTEGSDLARSFTAGDYRLHPQLQKQSDGAEAVAYWTAYNVKTKRPEFHVGPDALQAFAKNTELHVDAAARSGLQGIPTHPYEIESQRATEALMNEGVGAAFQHLGAAWGAASRDPEWWTKTTVNLVTTFGPAMVARGAGATAALTEEATPELSEATRAAAAIAAKRVAATARAAEPQITASVSTVAEANGGKMIGLEARLKTEESLARKIGSDARQPEKVESAAANVKDAVRYTTTLDDSRYGAGYRAAIKDLEAQGYNVQGSKNSWASQGYRGVNTTFRAPSGQLFEVQFHTPDSFAAKSAGHALYEEWRAPGTSVERRAVLSAEMSARFKMVPIPPGAIDVNLLQRLASQGIAILLSALPQKEDR